ncbi:tripartite tricarboxylate transporter substrate binding protein [Pusillimonas sp. SM2304]|uniref:Bug family tripartite tricarboxylate transporter substrate binding protein n=1 Tax=Pusillimonas sp. SM2304 TaxID=3073241 RepID=UPI002875C473|nr:tripartite tricarboxylate transporter substrate binding protein [Pusillimonas sp. SM2304]MDS1140079.1 tripartite tricarboxylate transporter substrate binding protein [Pusillimonas sp. SM2304]
MTKLNIIRRKVLAAGMGLAVAAFGSNALAQSAYPDKPIRLLIPFAPGGTTDVVGRIVAEGMARELGQPIVVVNRGGAGGAIGARELSRATPDGYTIGLMNVSTHGTNSAVRDLDYDILKDFTSVAKLTSFPGVIAVNPKFEGNTYSKFMRLLQDNPGQYSYGSSGAGGATNLAMEQFKMMTGLKVTHIPYRGSGPALSDVIAGQVPMILDALPSAMSFIQAGQLTAIGLAGTERSPQLPDLPTFDELGVKGYAPDFWNGIMAPANLPADIQATLHAAIQRTLARKDIKERLEALGASVSTGTSEEMATQIREDAEVWKKVAEFAQIRVD